jgi:hypothetical protein
MGLMQDLIDAKLAGERIRRKKLDLPGEPILTKAMEKEAELTRDAILNFLTSDDLIWTIDKFKASVELEEISTEELGAKVDTNVDTNVNVSNISGAPSAGGGIIPGTGTGTGKGKGTGTGTVSEGLNMRRDGGKHGGELMAVGYAYIGDKEVVGVDNISPKNEETEVRLDIDRIPEELK